MIHLQNSLLVTEGDIIVLSVTVIGEPSPDVRFFFGDERFVSEPKNGITIISEGKSHRLILEDANLDDAGNYSCLG